MNRSLCFSLIVICFICLLSSCEKEAFLILNDPKTISFTEFGGEQTISFTTNKAWTASSSDSWCTIDPSSSGSKTEGDITITISCKPNSSLSPRSTTVVIKTEDLAESITINQADVNPESLYSSEPHFSESVELMCLIWRLTGVPEFNSSVAKKVAESADSYFSSMLGHNAVELAKEYRSQGISYDAVASYGLHLLISDNGSITLNPFFVEETDISFRWSDSQKKSMLKALNDFYKKSNFHEWYQSLEPLRQQAIESFNSKCTIEHEWFDRFYEPIDNLYTQIIPSFLSGSSSFGLSADLSYGGKLISPVLGLFKQDNSGTIIYGNSNPGNVIHEFSHPYCNPLIDKYWGSMATKADSEYSKVESQMIPQAYTTAKIMMYETLVRACTNHYLITHGYRSYKEKLIQNDENRGFMMVRCVVDALEKREQNMSKYPTLDAFMPEIVKAINAYQQ